MRAQLVGVGASGRRVGESHPRATLSDHEVDLLLELSEEFSLSVLAEKFEIAKSTAHSIVTGRTRAKRPDRYRRVKRNA